MKNETKNEAGKPALLQGAVSGRAFLLSIGEKIKSSRTGRVLECFSKMNVYVGEENILHNTEYSMWDAERKKCKGYRGRELQNMLNGVWAKMTCR